MTSSSGHFLVSGRSLFQFRQRKQRPSLLHSQRQRVLLASNGFSATFDQLFVSNTVLVHPAILGALDKYNKAETSENALVAKLSTQSDL